MDRIYLDNAATTIPRPEVFEAGRKYIDKLSGPVMSSYELIDWTSAIAEKARVNVANMLGCGTHEVAFQKSTSQALGTVVGSLPLEAGDNVLVCDIEYQASTACWHPRADNLGIEIRKVETDKKVVTVDDYSRYIDKHTKAILLASVQEINGSRADVAKISELAKKHGIYLIVDGVQEIGEMNVSVKDMGVDFYCSGGKKWIGNPFGMGFMYVNEELLDRIKPPYYSYIDTIVPSKYYDDEPTVQAYLAYLEDPARSPFDSFDMKKNATVFESGGYDNYIGLAGLGKAVEVLDNYGFDNVERTNLKHTHMLIDGLQRLGLNVTSPLDEQNMSAIVTFSLGDLSTGNISRERELIEFLYKRDIFVSLRCAAWTGGVRVSPHWFTPDDHIQEFLDGVKAFIKR